MHSQLETDGSDSRHTVANGARDCISKAFDIHADDWGQKGKLLNVIGDDNPILSVAASILPGQTGLIVDIGGGDGRFLDQLRRNNLVGPFVLIDRSPRMVAAASRDDDQFLALVADAENVPLPNSCARAVIFKMVLHHLPDPSIAVLEAHRILALNGTLILQVPGPGYFAGWAPFGCVHRWDAIGRFHPAEIEKLLTRCGFSVEVRVCNFAYLFLNHAAAWQHLFNVGLLSRLVAYEEDLVEQVRSGLALMRPAMTELGGPIHVPCDYVVAIGRKER